MPFTKSEVFLISGIYTPLEPLKFTFIQITNNINYILIFTYACFSDFLYLHMNKLAKHLPYIGFLRINVRCS